MFSWEQFAIYEAAAALHAIFMQYAAKYFTVSENAAFSTVFTALADLPRRIHAAAATDAPIATNAKKGK